MPLQVILNGETRELEALTDGAKVAAVVASLGFKADRIAIERNGEIVPRRRWSDIEVMSGDKLEVVHFVGGGNATTSGCGTVPQAEPVWKSG